MADHTKNMLKNSLDALVNLDIRLAQTVFEEDDAVDEINSRMYRQVEAGISENPANLALLINMLGVSRQSEQHLCKQQFSLYRVNRVCFGLKLGTLQGILKSYRLQKLQVEQACLRARVFIPNKRSTLSLVQFLWIIGCTNYFWVE